MRKHRRERMAVGALRQKLSAEVKKLFKKTYNKMVSIRDRRLRNTKPKQRMDLKYGTCLEQKKD